MTQRARYERILTKAIDTFGSKEKALRWLQRPTRPLQDQAPITLIDTDEGTVLVEDLLGRIGQGLAN